MAPLQAVLLHVQVRPHGAHQQLREAAHARVQGRHLGLASQQGLVLLLQPLLQVAHLPRHRFISGLPCSGYV